MEKDLAIFLLAAAVIQLSAVSASFLHAAAQVGTSNIANNAITSPKIRDGEVKTPEIANNAITTSKISNGAVDTNDLADNSVTSDKIEDGSITSADLSSGATLSTSNQKLSGASEIIFNACSIDFPSIPAQVVAFAFCSVSGARAGDKIIITNQDPASGLLTQSASVNSTDLVRIAVRNPNFSAADPPKMSWAMIIFRT